MNLRILHCPTVVGGNPPALCRAQRALGAASWSVSLTPDPYGYGADEDLHAGRSWLVRELARWRMVRRALRDYDVIHYNFGNTLAPIRSRVGGKGWRAPAAVLRNLLYAAPLELCDLRWAARRGKVIAVTFQGDDARQGAVARRWPVHFAHEVPAGYYTDESDRHARERIAGFARHADLLYALNPDLLAVLPERARFQAYASVDAAEWRPDHTARARPGAPLRIVHAPSHRAVKGTHHVVAAVEQLRGEGLAVELVLVEGVTNAEARRIYQTADLAVDQVLAGFYGALAVELMALEIPVVCYLRDVDLGRLPAAMRAELPVIGAAPESLATVLREWAGPRRGGLAEQGRRGREFVRRWHAPAEIARATLADYQAAWESKRAGRAGTPGAAAHA